MSLVEVMIAVTVIVIAASSLIGHVAITYRGARAERDRVFAYNAAQSMLAEIHAAAADSLDNPQDIDAFDDGSTAKDTLSVITVGGALLPPDHEVSRNTLASGQWTWARQVSVAPVPGADNRSLRYVTVRVMKRDRDGSLRSIAAVSSIVNGLAAGYATTQVYDVYFIAIENIPGWWVHMESIRPFMESIVAELEGKNPGLELRTHWITKAGYGRDPSYRPYVNDSVDSEQPIDYVYFYPGRMPEGNASTYYYVPSAMRARFVTELGERNGHDASTNPYPYAFADGFNHTMRFPQEQEYHDLRLSAVRDRKQDIVTARITGTREPPSLVDMSEEPTLRLFLEELNASPDSFRHALILNLHGELLPLPAMRNYSDAAKDPVGLPGVRVVTHPEELRTQRPPSTGDTDVRLRVYAYVEDPLTWSGVDRMPEERPIAIQVMDLDLTDGSGGLFSGVIIENLAGGVDVGGSRAYAPMGGAKHGDDPSLRPGEMYYDAAFVDPGYGLRKYTLIKLHNTPVVCPPVVSGSQTRGLFANERSRLYGLEYVPSCAGTTRDFSRDLYTAGDGPKNTARWVIEIPGTVFESRRWTDLATPPTYHDPREGSEPDRLLTIRTRIWDPSLPDPLLTGTWPRGSETRVIQPANLSETYTWWAATRDAVPFTERCQFTGDPRHNPYKDLLSGDPDFPNGYNWFFDDLASGSRNAASDFAGLDTSRLFDRWMGRVRHDVPREFALLRDGLIRSRTVFTTLNGYSFYYVGNGGEIGSDSTNGYPDSIPVALDPYGKPEHTGHANTITEAQTFVRSSDPHDYWWGMPWLGELCPDRAYASQWLGRDSFGDIVGNLRAGTEDDEFWQEDAYEVYKDSNFLAYATTLNSSIQRTQNEGCTSFFNCGSSSGRFQHIPEDGTGVPSSAGVELINNYNLSIPPSPSVNRPFSVSSTRSGGVPSEWNLAPYSDQRTRATLGRVYFDSTSSSGDASAMVDLEDAARENQASIVVNGFAASTVDGVSFIARYCLVSALHSLFETGDPARAFRVKPMPRVEIVHPTEINQIMNPTVLRLEFDAAWQRWDGRPYTESTPGDFAESEGELEYALLYSRDNGISWQNMIDGSSTMLGTRADGGLLHSDRGTGPELFDWSVPGHSFPAGSYLVRVECYRAHQALHYAHHQRKVFIQR